LDKALEELGVHKIEAVGKKFDPNFHEAVREVEGQEDGMIIEEYQVGYTINGKVIRPSQVGIGKAGSTKP
jgi:molecular chaperone GrpE